MLKEISSFILRVSSPFKPLMVHFTAVYTYIEVMIAANILSWLVVTASSMKIAPSKKRVTYN